MIYCFLADGFEETEAIATIDMLKRANKDVLTVGVGGEYIKSSHGITIKADVEEKNISIADEIEAVILPGGMPGTLNLEKSEVVSKAINYCAENERYLCAICAAPSILGHKGLLNNKEAICYPGFENELYGASISKKSVVCDGYFITAKGAGVAVDFGLEIVSKLCGQETAESIRASIQCND